MPLPFNTVHDGTTGCMIGRWHCPGIYLIMITIQSMVVSVVVFSKTGYITVVF